jgi:hypothetical protein
MGTLTRMKNSYNSKEALAAPDRDGWVRATEKEINNMNHLFVYNEVDCMDGMHVINSG